jgi:hypothetical protein
MEVPISTRFNDETSSMNLADALLYISQTIWILAKKKIVNL